MKILRAFAVAAGLALVVVVASGAQEAANYGVDPNYKVPRLADGQPDLQGVWGNNSVTPMARPRQWKDKTLMTDAELTELKQLAGAVGRSGRRRDLRQLHPADSGREGEGRVQADVVRSVDRQLQPVLDGRSRVGPPHVAHHRSARRPVSGADRRGAGPPHRRRRASAHARSVGWSRRSAALGALHFVRRAAHGGELQQLHADHPVARHGRAAAGNDSRRARRADDRTSRTCRRRFASCTAIRAAAGKATRSSSKPPTTSTDSRARRRT